MRFENVAIVSVGHEDAPHRIRSEDIEAELAPTLDRLGMPRDVLRALTGVRARRFWDVGFLPSQAATLAAEKAIARAGIDRSKIGVLINTSVCRDYLEPSVACFVHHNLRLGPACLNFDLTNACLGFLDGMQVVGNMIERGQVDYGLVVDGEGSRHVVEQTVARLARDTCDMAMFREQFATLTVGSGAAAVLLAHSRLEPAGHAFLGGVSVAATEHNRLCRGQVDVGLTDSQNLLNHGVEIAKKTWDKAQLAFGWSTASVDSFALHQVSEAHTSTLADVLGFERSKAFLIYPELGNVGPASVPIVLSKADEASQLHAGDRVVLAGIGSGLNATAAGVLW